MILILGSCVSKGVGLAEAPGDHSESLIGHSIGNWRVERLLGEGGMGRVYLCEHATLAGKYAAAKLLLPEVSQNMAVVERFLAEARAASAVEHPNIIEILDAGRLPAPDSVPYIVMRFVEGHGSLEDYCENHGVLDAGEVCEVLVQACAALSAAHARGIVHRDIKPANLLVSERPESRLFVTVVDFGIAKLFDPELKAGVKTKTNMVIGTPGYMAPEQSRGAKIDARADIYSLGVIGHSLLLGRLPFEGQSFGDILLQQMTAEPPDLRPLRPDVPEAFAAVLRAALAVEPGDRPQSARELAHQLAAATPGGAAILERVARSILPMGTPSLAGQPSAASGGATVVAPSGLVATPPRLPTTPLAAEVAHPLPNTASALKPRPRPRRWWPALAGLLCVVAAVVVGSTVLRNGDGRVAATSIALDAGNIAGTLHSRADAAISPPADASVPSLATDLGADAGTRGRDAGSESEQPTRVEPKKPRSTKPTGSGTISVQVAPWATVSIDGVDLGVSPLKKSMPAGRHVVVIANEDLGKKETIRVKVRPKKTVSIKRTW